jgi:outer membrane protein assembly factor BamB
MTKPIRIKILAVALLLGGLVALPQHASAQNRVPLWTNYCNVSPIDQTPGFYGGHLLCTDNSGNVIVAGLVNGGSSSDFAAVKISSSGVSLWTNRFSSPDDRPDVALGVAVDSANNVFVAGYGTYSDTDEDYVTIKYSSAGTPLWTNRYNGPAGSYDDAVAMAVDSDGNVIVTGNSRGAGGYNEAATVKYSNSGAFQWTQRYGDSSGAASAVSVAVDSTNVYVAGINTADQFVIFAYSSLSGTPLWTNTYTYGPGWYNARPDEIAADNSGHVFVTGHTATGLLYGSTPVDQDFVTLAYSSAGTPLWTNLYQGPGLNNDNNDYPVGLAVSAGRVFVLGSSEGPDPSVHFATVVYSTAGATLWTNRFSGDWGGDSPQATAADSAGNVFVTGTRGDLALGGGIYVTLAYSGSGVLLWSNEVVYPLIGPTEIAVDKAGNVFVTGSDASGGVTLKYASSLPSLALQWLNNQLVITWNSPSCTLQSSPSITGAFTNIIGASSPFTNSTSGSQQFFRLQCD